MLEFLSDALQWFVATILVPIIALGVLAGVSFGAMWVIRLVSGERRRSFEEWDRDTKEPDDEQRR